MNLSKDSIRPGSSEAELFIDRVQATAVALGIDRVAAAHLNAPLELGFFDEWLDRGYNAGMHYMKRNLDKRRDPAALFPGAQSILCAALGYYVRDPRETSVEDQRDEPGRQTVQAGTGRRPRVSRCARAPDYHRILKDKLHNLLSEIQRWVPGIRGRVTVDTAPILERYWAEQAGLGWIGKNCCLFVPGMGSWVFLGEILLDVPLPTGKRLNRRCGTCRKCLDACPAGALVEAGQLDARRCISYWTIEHKGEFPREAPRLRPWLFGCDSCQEVCPWNREPAEARDAAVHPDWEAWPRDREDWASLTHDAFERRLANTPLERTGYDGLQRNLRRLDAEGLQRDQQEP